MLVSRKTKTSSLAKKLENVPVLKNIAIPIISIRCPSSTLLVMPMICSHFLQLESGVREVILKVFYLFVILIAIATERNETQLTTVQKDENTSGSKIAISFNLII